MHYLIVPGGFVGLHPPRSFHSGTVNVLVGDGRVSLVTDTIAPRIWAAMGTHDLAD